MSGKNSWFKYTGAKAEALSVFPGNDDPWSTYSLKSIVGEAISGKRQGRYLPVERSTLAVGSG